MSVVGFGPLEALITLQQRTLDRTQESQFLRVHSRENFKLVTYLKWQMTR